MKLEYNVFQQLIKIYTMKPAWNTIFCN